MNPIQSLPEPWKSHLARSESLLNRNQALLEKLQESLDLWSNGKELSGTERKAVEDGIRQVNATISEITKEYAKLASTSMKYLRSVVCWIVNRRSSSSMQCESIPNKHSH